MYLSLSILFTYIYTILSLAISYIIATLLITNKRDSYTRFLSPSIDAK